MNEIDRARASRMDRRGVLAAFAATAITAAPAQAGLLGFLRNSGDTRRLRMYSGRTGEAIDMIYYANGRYIDEAVREVSYFMRDWRENKAIRIDHRTLDIMAASHRLLDVDEPYLLLSGYRTSRTNDMLRRRSGGVARRSLHLTGQAADLRLKSRSVNQIARAAQACSAGGVGKYFRSNFVHMDCGPVRSWTG